MTRLILTLLCLSTFTFSYSQFVATVELKEDIEGLCDQKTVYVLFPGFKGQVEAQNSLSKEEILVLLNAKLGFLKENPKYKAKGTINLIINCKGEIVQFDIDSKKIDPKLVSQLEDLFRSLNTWEPATLNDDKVDSLQFYGFKIKKGKVYWD